MKLALMIGWIVLIGCYSTVSYSVEYPIYVYHDDAPFFLSHHQDISHEWVKEFNQRQNELSLVVTHISRPNLNSLIESGQSYIVLWANELWFKWRDKNVQASRPIFWDADTLVSNVDKAIDFSDPKKLFNLTIGTRLGHFYSNLNEYFKNRKIIRLDAKSSLENYKKLNQHKLDAFLDSRSTILYMQKNLPSSKNVYVSMNPQDAYSRNILVSKDLRWILPIINKVILEMHNDLSWQAKMEGWGLQELINPFELELKELNEI